MSVSGLKENRQKSTPAVPRFRALTETSELLENATLVLGRHAQALGGAFYYYLGGVRRVLVITDPRLLRHVLKDNWENYPKSAIQTRRMGEFLGPGLLTDHGEAWRRKRRVVQKAFTPDRMEALAAAMEVALSTALVDFDRRVAAGPFELGAELTRLTFATAARALFSAEMTDTEIGTISDGIRAVQEFIVGDIVRPYLQPWRRMTGARARHVAIRRGGDAILLRYIRARDDRGPYDLLRILIEASLGPNGERLSEQQILDEAMQVLIAGHETSSNALAWILWLLVTHPNEGALVDDELRRQIGERPVRAVDLLRLPLTIRAIQEALRLYPPFWMVDRVALADDMAGGVPIAAGTTVIAFIHGAHHDASYWREPDRFAPDRFDDSEQLPRHTFRHLPFGAGPKRCVGAAFAMLQMTIVLNTILKRYRLHFMNASAVQPEARIVLRPRGGLFVQAERLNAGEKRWELTELM